jgi:hypothetical protein
VPRFQNIKMKKNGKILISILNVFIDKSQLSSAQLSSARFYTFETSAGDRKKEVIGGHLI